MTENRTRRDLLAREAELVAELESRRTPSERQADQLARQGGRRAGDDALKDQPADVQQAMRLSGQSLDAAARKRGQAT